MREREVRQDAHERAAVALDARVPAAVVNDVDHVVVEGSVRWRNLGSTQGRDGRAGAEQRQGDLAVTAKDGRTQWGGTLSTPSPRFQIPTRGDDEFGGINVSRVTRLVKRSQAIVTSSVRVRARSQKKTHAGSAAIMSGTLE